MSEVTQSPTITIDNIAYDLGQFSDKVKQLTALYTRWEAETGEKRIEVMKNEAALRQLASEITGLVKVELAAKAEAAANGAAASPSPGTPEYAEPNTSAS